MNQTVASLALVIAWAFSGVAAAQQQIGNDVWICDGAAQAGPCQAEGDDDSSGSSSGGYTDNDYAHAEPKWADRWGAIASGKNEGTGVSVRAVSKQQAERDALLDCSNRGGSDCKILIAYYNQCAAMAASTQISTTYSAETEDQAKALALRECNKKSGDECWIYYSGCSLPEQIQ